MPRPPYRSWVCSSDATSDAAHAAFFALDIEAVLTHAGAFSEFTYRKYRSYLGFPSLDGLEIGPEDVDRVILTYPAQGGGTPWSIVLRGEFTGRRLASTLRARFEETALRGGYRIHWGADANVAVGVGDGTLVVGYRTDTRHEREVVEATLDTNRGSVRRNQAASAAFDRLVEVLGAGHDVSGLTHDRITEPVPGRDVFTHQVAKGHRYVFGPEESRSRYAFVFATEAAADTAAVAAWVDANDGPDDRLFGAYRRTSIAQQGRVVVVDGTLPTDAI